MKRLVLLISAVGLIAGVSSNSGGTQRRYFPEEEDEHRVSGFWWEDAEGNVRYENLVTSRMTKKTTVNDVTFYLYTKRNPEEPEVIRAANFTDMSSALNYNRENLNVFIVHGWNNGHYSEINELLKGVFVNNYDVNVFVVDWSKPANKNYFTAKAAVTIVGKAIGDFINGMISHYEISSKSFNLIGHSLGAHIVGCAGAEIHQKVNYIIGLDPALPLFSLNNKDNRIDETDGDFVQIVHTNGGNLAFSSSLGHADYYPNGGSKQPGCRFDIVGTCAHSRSYKYLAESLEHPGFVAHLCDSFKNYKNGKCSDNHRSFMGTLNVDKRANGDYYLLTNSESPYAMY